MRQVIQATIFFANSLFTLVQYCNKYPRVLPILILANVVMPALADFIAIKTTCGSGYFLGLGYAEGSDACVRIRGESWCAISNSRVGTYSEANNPNLATEICEAWKFLPQ